MARAIAELKRTQINSSAILAQYAPFLRQLGGGGERSFFRFLSFLYSLFTGFRSMGYRRRLVVLFPSCSFKFKLVSVETLRALEQELTSNY